MRSLTLSAGLVALPVAYCAARVLYRRLRGQASIVAASSSQRAPASLDPPTPAGWKCLRQTAHALLDAALDKLERAYDGRVWTPLPDELKSALKAPVPMQGMPHEEVAKRLTSLLPYGAGNTHPRFFGWVHGSGNPGGLLPEMVAAAMNANCGGRDHAHLYVERQVLAWCRSIMGFPTDCGGLLVSGTSMATLIALKAARDAALGDTAPRKRGLVRAQHQLGAELVGYAAEGAHSCLTRAFDVIGLGTDALRLVPTCEDFTLDVAALRNMIAADAAAGRRPFLIVGTAGSVNVGAVDDLNALADVAAEHSMWLHVDGAFGAPAVLSPVAAPLLAGLERATSLAFDFHKWLHVNYDCGCVLVRDHDAHFRAFAERPPYLAANDHGGLAGGSPWPVDYGLELSRGFRALKVWAHFLEHGTERLGAAITSNLAHARYLAALVDAAKDLQRLAPAALQIVVFRFDPPTDRARSAADDEAMDALNDAIVVRLQVDGVAAPSTTRVRGRLAIRVNLTNHRTRNADLELLVTAVERIGRELHQGGVGCS